MLNKINTILLLQVCIVFLIFGFIFPDLLKCQYPDPPCDTTLAPEIWSQPVKLPDAINPKGSGALFPFIHNDGKTLYFNNRDGICYSIITDTGWTKPVKLTDRINGSGLAQSASVTSDGKKLYFVDFIWAEYNWDIFVSNWDEKIQDWGYPINVKELNSLKYFELLAHISRDGKEIFITSNDEASFPYAGCLYGEEVCFSSWNDTTNKWNPKRNLGKNINYRIKCDSHYFSCGNRGGSMPMNDKKLYFCKDYGLPGNYDLFVSYKDSLGNWGKAMRLNINSYPDSPMVRQYRSTTGWDRDPSVTSDGKMLYFSSRRNIFVNGEMDQIWVSKLLVDENGRVVTNINNEKSSSPVNFDVYQNYPNPFNHETTIKYNLLNRNKVSLIIYDITGKEIRQIAEGQKDSGNYITKWNGKDRLGMEVSSGTYFYCLQVGNNYQVKKMMLVK